MFRLVQNFHGNISVKKCLYKSNPESFEYLFVQSYMWKLFHHKNTQTVQYLLVNRLFSLLSVSMALRLIKIYLKLFGIFPMPKQSLPTALRQYRMFINTFHIAFTGVSLLLYLSALAYFLFFKARTVVIIFQAIFFTTVTLMRVTLYFLIIHKRTQLLVLMDDLEQLVEMREFELKMT